MGVRIYVVGNEIVDLPFRQFLEKSGWKKVGIEVVDHSVRGRHEDAGKRSKYPVSPFVMSADQSDDGGRDIVKDVEDLMKLPAERRRRRAMELIKKYHPDKLGAHFADECK